MLKHQIAPHNRLPELTVVAWLMMISGLAFGFFFLLLTFIPLHPKTGSALSSGSTREGFAMVAFLAATTCGLGAGLRTRLAWAWSGTVFIALLMAYCGLLVPIIQLGVKNPKPGTALTAAVIGAIVLIPALLLWRFLFRSDIKTAFGISALPPLWIRIIAVSYLISSWLVILSILNPALRFPFGLIKNHRVACAYEVTSGVAWFLTGRSLYLLNESARRAAIFLTVISGLDYLGYLIFDPSTPTKLMTRLVTLLMVILIGALTIWYLHTRRQAFTAI